MDIKSDNDYIKEQMSFTKPVAVKRFVASSQQFEDRYSPIKSDRETNNISPEHKKPLDIKPDHFKLFKIKANNRKNNIKDLDKNTESESNILESSTKNNHINNTPAVKEFLPEKNDMNDFQSKHQYQKFYSNPKLNHIPKNLTNNNVETSIYFAPRKETENSDVYSGRTFGKFLITIFLIKFRFQRYQIIKRTLDKIRLQ